MQQDDMTSARCEPQLPLRLLTGSVPVLILRKSTAIMASALTIWISNITVFLLAVGLHPAIIAAVGISAIFASLLQAFSQAHASAVLSVLPTAMQKGPDDTQYALWGFLFTALCLAIFSYLAPLTFMTPILRILGAKGLILKEAQRFCVINFLSFPLVIFITTILRIVISFGKAKIYLINALAIGLGGTIFAYILTRLIPLGATGLGIANVLGRVMGLVLCVLALRPFLSKPYGKYMRFWPRYVLLAIRRTSAAVPPSLVLPLSLLALSHSLGRGSEDVLRAWGVLLRIFPLTTVPYLAIIQATMLLFGNNLAANQPLRSKQSVQWGFTYSVIFCAIMGLILYVSSDGFSYLFDIQTQGRYVLHLFSLLILVPFGFIGINRFFALLLMQLGKERIVYALNVLILLLLLPLLLHPWSITKALLIYAQANLLGSALSILLFLLAFAARNKANVIP